MTAEPARPEPPTPTREEIIDWALQTAPVRREPTASAPSPREPGDRRGLQGKPPAPRRRPRARRPSRARAAISAAEAFEPIDPGRRQEILELVADLAARLAAPEGRPGPIPVPIPHALLGRILELEPFMDPGKTYRLPMADGGSMLATGAELAALCRHLLALDGARDLRAARRALERARTPRVDRAARIDESEQGGAP